MYSKIPMPQFKWNDDDMKYMLVFFPWIGAVIGLLLMLWRYIYSHFGVADICYVCIGALIPLKHLAMKKPAQKTINALSSII